MLNKLLVLISILLLLVLCYYAFSNYTLKVEKVITNTSPSYALAWPNYNVTYESLRKEGFEYLMEDELILNKKVNEDISIQYWLEKDYGLVLMETWIINFSHFEISEVKEYLEEKRLRLLTPICSEDGTSYEFFVMSSDSYLIFSGGFYKNEESNNAELRIGHYFPAYPKGGIMRDHPRWQEN